MNVIGQAGLLIAFVGSGYAAFACLVGGQRRQRGIVRSGEMAAVTSVGALIATTVVLAHALLVKDFRFAYVAEYSSHLLPWHYSLSALWVGQAGSLLLWACLMGCLALAYGFRPRRESSSLRETAFGVLMGYVCFLVAIMVFNADPMKASLGLPREGAGLSPLLQHPAMLIHPPIVFLGYAGWAIPFALSVAALTNGKLDATWVREAREWSVFAWAVLGAGILLGAVWAYEELGWGGYWGWDPVENGSLIPWLTGTALIHTLMTWHHRGAFKKTTLALAIATFGLCNFATFLTRSGLFSSMHAFSSSPIGWMFLALMAATAAGGGILVWLRRAELSGDKPISSVWSREAFVLFAVIALLLLATVALVGTLAVPLSKILLGRAVVVGTPFYNNVLIPTGLVLLATTATAPLLRWGRPPSSVQQRMLFLVVAVGTLATGGAFLCGVRHAIALAVAGMAAAAVAAVTARWRLDISRHTSGTLLPSFVASLVNRRREYLGYSVHVGFVCVAIGVTGSSLGTRRHEVTMAEGQTVEWADHTVRFAGLIQRQLPDKLVAEAKLEVARAGADARVLLPAQHFHKLQNEWTTESAIASSWATDFFAILHGAEDDGRVHLTFILNPLMRFLWLGGWLVSVGAVLSLVLARQRSATQSGDSSVDSETSSTTPSRAHIRASHRRSHAA